MKYTESMLRDDALKGKTYVVTGGGTGLGKSMTKYFLQLGANVVITSRKLPVLQKTAEEYLALVRSANFIVPEDKISYPYLWWSREDLAIKENLFGIKPAPDKEETLINLIAQKPL